jgi:hypothetical protein
MIVIYWTIFSGILTEIFLAQTNELASSACSKISGLDEHLKPAVLP